MLGLSTFNSAFPGEARAGLALDVIVPCYDNEATIEAAISSLQRQTYPVKNIIVVDDASSDQSRLVVDRLATDDNRIRLVALQANRGAAIARNVGLHYAQSELVAFQDADDVSHPRRFELQVRALSRRNAVAVTCDGCRMIDGTEVELDGHYYHELPVSVLFRRAEVLGSVGFIRSITIGEDVDYLARMRIAFGEKQVFHLERCLYLASMRPGSAIYSHGEIREVAPGKYSYLPNAAAQEILTASAIRNSRSDDPYVPFDGDASGSENSGSPV